MSAINYKFVLIGNYDSGKATLFNKINQGVNPNQNQVNTVVNSNVSINLELKQRSLLLSPLLTLLEISGF